MEINLSWNNLAMSLENNISTTQKTGVLLTNIGSPEAPTPSAVRKFLAEFLADPRIIDWPRWLWLPILYGIVLLVRPKRSARLYQNIWDNGSPLLNIMGEQARQLDVQLKVQGRDNLKIALGMRYGTPSISQVLRDFREEGFQKILIFPLFPQYSSTTTASTYDAVNGELEIWAIKPEIYLIDGYHDNLAYIRALARSILDAWEVNGKPEKLLFSYHGIPRRYLEQSDKAYEEQCWQTARLVADQLELTDSAWQVSFQSRFGPEEWVQPFTDEILQKWGQEKIKSVHVICPGFSADCLETLDQITREYQEVFEIAGGTNFYYIPALNYRQDHIEALGQIISEQLHNFIQKDRSNQPDTVATT